MEITCSNCKTSFVLPEDKVPEAKRFRLNCPKCREPIVIDALPEPQTHVAPDHFPRDAVVAFVFLSNATLVARVGKFLKARGIFVSEAKSIIEAMEKISINYYQHMLLENSEYSSTILKVVRKWNGLRRRDINIIQLEADCPSMHTNEAFLRGVNSVIGATDTDRIEYMLELALGDYASYIDTWKTAERNIATRDGRA